MYPSLFYNPLPSGRLRQSPVMEWSGRAPAPPASYAGKGRQRQGARYAFETQHRNRRSLNMGSAAPLIVGKQVKAIATLSRNRTPAMPDLATAHEQGLVDFDVVTWNAFFLPKGAPPDDAAFSRRTPRSGLMHRSKCRRRVAISHSITSSASARKFGGNSMPVAFAVLRLITSG